MENKKENNDDIEIVTNNNPDIEKIKPSFRGKYEINGTNSTSKYLPVHLLFNRDQHIDVDAACDFTLYNQKQIAEHVSIALIRKELNLVLIFNVFGICIQTSKIKYIDSWIDSIKKKTQRNK